jgi:hypothetical protein
MTNTVRNALMENARNGSGSSSSHERIKGKIAGV